MGIVCKLHGHMMLMLNYIKTLFLVVCIHNFLTAGTPNYIQLASGVNYAHTCFNKQSIHVLAIDPQNARIDLMCTQPTMPQKVSEFVQKTTACAGVNGGFFDFGCGKVQSLCIKALDCIGYTAYGVYPVFTLKNHGKFHALSSTLTGACAWKKDDQQLHFNTVASSVSLRVHDVKFPVHAFNISHARGPRLYSDAFGSFAPQHIGKALYVTFNDNYIQDVSFSNGSKPIPIGGYVYILPHKYARILPALHKGDLVDIQCMCIDQYGKACFNECETILSGTPLLVHKGQVCSRLFAFKSSFYSMAHPRTAIGVRADGHWLLVVIDGRSKNAQGMSIVELAQTMKNLGCIAALNLDGGGSSTMIVNQAVVNKPSGRKYSFTKKERPVANALLINADLS